MNKHQAATVKNSTYTLYVEKYKIHSDPSRAFRQILRTCALWAVDHCTLENALSKRAPSDVLTSVEAKLFYERAWDYPTQP